MNTRPPPHPELRRVPSSRFGWLEVRLLDEGWLAHAGPEATAVLTLLALVADRRGASYWSRSRMVHALALPRDRLDQALQHLLALGLVAHRPWKPGDPDGVWQLLPLAPAPPRTGTENPESLGSLLKDLRPGTEPTPPT